MGGAQQQIWPLEIDVCSKTNQENKYHSTHNIIKTVSGNYRMCEFIA